MKFIAYIDQNLLLKRNLCVVCDIRVISPSKYLSDHCSFLEETAKDTFAVDGQFDSCKRYIQVLIQMITFSKLDYDLYSPFISFFS